jgi:hypothetical protein
MFQPRTVKLVPRGDSPGEEIVVPEPFPPVPLSILPEEVALLTNKPNDADQLR